MAVADSAYAGDASCPARRLDSTEFVMMIYITRMMARQGGPPWALMGLGPGPRALKGAPGPS